MNHQRAEAATPGPGGPAQLPGDVPAPLLLSALGCSLGNKHQHDRSPAAEFQAEIGAPCQRGNGPIGQVTNADPREVAEMRQENRRLREDMETLKGAAAICLTIPASTPTARRSSR